jgi:hypothetical protein
MPCGGIYPVKGSWIEQLPIGNNPPKCWQCQNSTSTSPPDHFCDEWDCFLHSVCVAPFLLSEEGQVVISHGHEVLIHFGEQEHSPAEGVALKADKKVLLSAGDGPDGIEIYTSEDRAAVDWAHDIPALYVDINLNDVVAWDSFSITCE